MEIEECLSAFASALMNDLARQKPDEQEKWPSFIWRYDHRTRAVTFGFIKPDGVTDTYNYEITVEDEDSDFWEWLNVGEEDRSKYLVTKTDPTWVFPNVWDRRDLYIHASFVNYTSYGYLGRDGEFYPKPSKIYHFEWQPMQFFFEVSFDGMRPVVLPYEHFEVELSFIIDDKRYQSQ
jgi:hypothetical protein